MNSGAKGGATRVSIPSSVKKTIEDIKEFTSNNHSEDDIYAMLKECGMDPNETTQRLLLLDTFHEVKRRHRKKENHKEPEDQKWKPGTQLRSDRVGRANYTQHASQDTGGGRSTSGLKENASSYAGDKVNTKVLPAAPLEMKKSSSPNESLTGSLSNGPSDMASHKVRSVNEKHISPGGEFHLSDEHARTGKPKEPLPRSSLAGSSINSDSVVAKNTTSHELLQLGNGGDALLSSASGSYLSSSGSQDLPAADIDSQLEHGKKHATFQLPDDNLSARKSTSSNTFPTEVAAFKLPTGFGQRQHLESLTATSLTFGAPAGDRPSSYYNDRSQVIGQQKEWKPKSSHSNGVLRVATGLSEGSVIRAETQPEFRATHPDISSEKVTLELERKFKDTNLEERKHVIIPSHLHVPEVKKLGFCFGSFDVGFELDMSQGVVGESDGKTPVLSEPVIPNDEPVKELKFRVEGTMQEVQDTDIQYSEHPETMAHQPPTTTLEQNEPSLETAHESPQNMPYHTPSSYNIGLVQPIVSSQVSPLESLESQARDFTRLPGFTVPQSFDPASYYTPFYRSGALDSDGRISPVLPAGSVNDYNGNNTVISSQTGQTHPELQANGPLVFSTAPAPAPAQLVTQAAGVMHSSIPVTQQPLPLFRHPSSVHLPQIPPNFIPYGPYFSPYYVPPPAIHQFLGNGMFPQQHQSGSLYASAQETSSKFSVAQFRQGSNTGNSTQVGLPGSYGAYGLPMAGYTSSSPSSTVPSSSNDDPAVPHVKENSAYIGVQQNNGSGVWFTTPTGDIASLQASTFYNLPQGQMSFNPTGPGHGAPFTGIFHPAQGVAPTATNVHPILQQSQTITSHVDMVGQTTPNAYQQPQPNWPSNY